MSKVKQHNRTTDWLAWLIQKIGDFLRACGEKWKSFRRWYDLLQPARICFLVSLVVPVLFCYVDQGRDTLRRIASDPVSLHTMWMFIGMWIAGLASWGWARFLLSCNLYTANEGDKLPSAQLDRARLVVRRICGVLPPTGMGAGFLVAADNSGTIWSCIILATLSFAVAVVLWFSFEPLVRLRRTLNQSKVIKGRDVASYTNVADIKADTAVKWTILVTWSVSALIFVALTKWSVGFGMTLGSPAVILFAVAVWISIGSALVYLAERYRVPLLTALALWAIFCSYFNDNHAVRTLPVNSGTTVSPPLIKALDQWYAQVSTNYPIMNSQQKRPIYLVAAAGGGIRAAYWTAIVLGRLEDCAQSNRTSFAAHTFALSGVSGGSLGEITFVALKTHPPPVATNSLVNVRKLLRYDFLAADLAKMAFADLLQRFLPFPIGKFDRARSLEDAWEAAWVHEFHTNVLGESVADLYGDAVNREVILPHLLLNGTCVETGQRIITSDLLVQSRIKANGENDSSGSFLDIIPATEKLSNAPIRLSTAAHQSARFTYFSPAGLFKDGTHIVDGGYFENSGASTLMDVLRAVQWRIQSKNWTNVEPRIILIDNDPIALKSKLNTSRLMSETLSPVQALLNTRTARGSYAVEQALDYTWRATNVYQFDLYQRPENEPLGNCSTPAELPLGWTLSQCAMDEMDAQLTLPFAYATNSVEISDIVATLPLAASAH